MRLIHCVYAFVRIDDEKGQGDEKDIVREVFAEAAESIKLDGVDVSIVNIVEL